MKRKAIIVQGTAFALAISLVTLGAVGLYNYTSPSSGTTTGTNLSGSGAFNTQSSQYLGYLPAGYTVVPRSPNAPVYSCPANFNSTQCTQFKASCGNGICDPNETCSTCPIDCGVPQGLSCDPYTGRASGVGGVCELSIPYSNTQPGGVNNILNNPGSPQTPTTGG